MTATRRKYPFTCLVCGRQSTGRKGQRFCSQRCQNIADYRRHAEKRRAERRERYAREREARPPRSGPPSPLAPEVLAAIAAAPPTLSTMALVRQLGLPDRYRAIRGARLRMREAGGWYCALNLAPCTECGQPLVHPRLSKTHAECRRARELQTRVGHRVAPWTERNPAKRRALIVAALRADPSRPDVHIAVELGLTIGTVRTVRDALEEAGEIPTRGDPTARARRMAARAAALARLSERGRREYEETLRQAVRRDEPWSEADERYLLEHPRQPARDVALALGRTLWQIRERRKGRPRPLPPSGESPSP